MSQLLSTDKKKKPFRLVKFFAYASFAVLLAFSFPFSVIVAQKAKDMLLNSYENYALLLGENLNHQVFQNFVIPVVNRYGKIRLRDKEQYELMDRIVNNTVHGYNVDLVNIYDIEKGVIAYSTDPRLLGKKVVRSLGYNKAVMGENSSGLISGTKDLWGLGIELLGGERKLRTYIPFRGIDPYVGDTGYVLGVFEIIQDLTKPYQSLVRFQYTIFGLSLVIMGLIFLALLLIVRKAEMTIEERAREQRELQAQLHQAERLAALGQMVAGVSHEIRNPLGIIRSTAELLGGLPNADEAQKKLSMVIVEESSRLNNVVTEFLDFARPQKPNVRDCSLTEIINKNIAFLEPELKKSQVQITQNLDGRNFPLKGDPEMLYRAFLNIFINAIHAIGKNGEIEITGKEDKAHYTISIRDSGCGIARDDLNRVFNPFFTTKEKGTGLGLSIVRKIIELHQGSITLESSEDEGTTVHVTLPKDGPVE
ncbi:MAG: two-component sensor histidine kinase [Deltaproteobacteria bacterium]|nr:MAG: two-component sensor histidine kinase [Deltaproteobacteria bacterium]